MMRIHIKKLRPYRIRIGCTLLGCIGGFWGAATGFLVGWFVEHIYITKHEQDELIRFLQNPQPHRIDEPFTGAIGLCALCTYCVQDASVVLFTLKKIYAPLHFSGSLYEKMELYVYASLRASDVNYDFLCEYTAALFKKALAENMQTSGTYFSVTTQIRHIIHRSVELLRALENGWDTVRRGQSPSQMISALLGDDFILESRPTVSISDLPEAYNMLALPMDSSLRKIKNRYRELVSLYHPDAVVHLSTAEQKKAHEEFLKIDRAYRCIIENR